MAHYVAEGSSATSTSSCTSESTDLAKWLEENKLKRLAVYFHSQEVDLDELKMYSTEMIEL